MLFNECVENVSTFLDLKRFANEYVIDYKRLTFEELKSATIKTAPQYSNEDNIRKVVDFFDLHTDRNMRILFRIFMQNVLLNADDFMENQRVCEEKIIAYENSIVDLANEFSLKNEVENIEFYKYVVEAAWDKNNDISVDEQNLINKIRERLRISRKNHQILEAQIGKFPQNGNILHSRDDILNVRRQLQFKGLIISVRDANGIDYDAIPREIVDVLRKIFGVDIKESSYAKLIESKYVKSKSYLLDILSKANIKIPKHPNLPQLQEVALKHITAHQLLGGFSANGGIDKTTLSEWCVSLGLNGYGNKNDMINRIISYYDDIRQIQCSESDEREKLYHFYNDLASRNLSMLRQQGIITKDLECEHKFEEATNYIFEKIFKIKPLIMSGTEHPDGMLSFNDKLIMWDNKSKETSVSLSDHIKQFDRYIKNSTKPVSVFMVIGPSFTDESQKECAKYALSNDTIILLITADELKSLAQNWQQLHGEDGCVLPLGIFKQNGRFNPDLVVL
ncbi:MAG: hypothetical protein PUB43_00195 [Oscillospiraceae bacterium]|nr:hypothetical protein [Oscillospiraceae bacterium]